MEDVIKEGNTWCNFKVESTVTFRLMYLVGYRQKCDSNFEYMYVCTGIYFMRGNKFVYIFLEILIGKVFWTNLSL